MSDTTAKPSQARFGVLALLLLVYTFNFLDRQILGILAVPIKAEFHVSDKELGLLGGLAFALFYSGLGIPIAWLADRVSRTWIITISLALWSAFTAASGLATNFGQLFLARVGVGVGEAGGVAPAYSLLADYFPKKERARAFAVYSFGIPIGSALGLVLGAILASLIDWRTAFIAVGLAGLLIAPVFRRYVKEPERGRFDAAPLSERAGIMAALRTVGVKPTFWLLAFGASCASIVGYGLFFWVPSFLVRSYQLSLKEASYYFAAMIFIGGIVGIWLSGVITDWLGSRSKRAYPLVPAIAFVLALPCYIIGILSPSLSFAFVLLLVPTALGLSWLSPILTAAQHLGPANMRATISALFLFINNLIGLGAGTYIIGALSDALTLEFGQESLRYSIIAGSSFYVISALLFFLTARFIEKDWQD